MVSTTIVQAQNNSFLTLSELKNSKQGELMEPPREYKFLHEGKAKYSKVFLLALKGTKKCYEVYVFNDAKSTESILRLGGAYGYWQGSRCLGQGISCWKGLEAELGYDHNKRLSNEMKVEGVIIALEN